MSGWGKNYPRLVVHSSGVVKMDKNEDQCILELMICVMIKFKMFTWNNNLVYLGFDCLVIHRLINTLYYTLITSSKM